MIEEGGVVTGGEFGADFAEGVSGASLAVFVLEKSGAIAEEIEVWLDFGLPEVIGNGCVDVRGEVVPLIGILGDAEGGVSDTDKEAHQGDAFGWRAIEISDFVPSFERGSKRDEGRVVVGSGEPTDGDPGFVDEVEVVHEIL